MVGEDPRLSATNQAHTADRRSPAARPPSPGDAVAPTASPVPPHTGPASTAEHTTHPVAVAGPAAPAGSPAAGGTPAVDAAGDGAGERERSEAGDLDRDHPAGGDTARPAARADRSFLAWGVASYAVVLGAVLALALRAADGHLVYVLDDPAIHRSVAANLVDHGTWGVTPGHFESASSSPLWTLLLAALVAVAPATGAAGPLLINAVAAVAVIAVLGANQTVLSPSRRRPGDAAAVTLLVVVALFLPGLTTVGMEHIVHMALVLGAIVLLHRQGLGELGRWPRWLPYALLALATLARLETTFVAAGLALALLARCRPVWGPGERACAWRTQARRAALAGAAAAIPLAAVAAATRLGGQGWLPNSILAKSRVENTLTPAYRLPVERLTADPLVGVLAVGLVVALVAVWRRPVRFAFPAVVAVVTVAFHVSLARVGWYERYQGYLVALLVYAGLELAGDVLGVRAAGPGAVAAPGPGPAGTGGARPAVGALLVLALLPFCGTKVFLTVDAPLAVADTYEQRYQAGRFLARYYPGEPVATGELGYVSLMHDGPITDLWGLGDYEVLQARMEDEHPDAEYWSALAARRGFQVAAVYPSTIGFDTPPDWLLAGWWTLPRRTVTAFEPRFEFWATSPQALLRLQEHLRDFTDDLPGAVEVTINDPAALAAAQALNPATAATAVPGG
jgi:hypothetical protein